MVASVVVFRAKPSNLQRLAVVVVVGVNLRLFASSVLAWLFLDLAGSHRVSERGLGLVLLGVGRPPRYDGGAIGGPSLGRLSSLSIVLSDVIAFATMPLNLFA